MSCLRTASSRGRWAPSAGQVDLLVSSELLETVRQVGQGMASADRTVVVSSTARALTVVASAAQAFEWVGMPEGTYFLSQACLYLATAPKSNSAGAVWQALSHIEEHGPGDVPPYLRDKTNTFSGTTRDRYKEAMGDMGEYKYPHNYPGGWVAQQYLPLDMEPPGWYQPKDIGYEAEVRERMPLRKQP